MTPTGWEAWRPRPRPVYPSTDFRPTIPTRISAKEAQPERRSALAERDDAGARHAERADADPDCIGGADGQALQRARKHEEARHRRRDADDARPEIA
jgi:hypothetical protein